MLREASPSADSSAIPRGSGRIRPCLETDLPHVAGLFQKVFRRTESPPSSSLTAYLRTIYFQHPCYSPDYPSLVYENDRGGIVGFLGALPVPLVVNHEPIRAAVAGNLMVDPSARNPFAGAKLVRTFLEGRQDLSFSDTANSVSRRMWEACGGETLLLGSLQWLRVLRPAQFGGGLLKRHCGCRGVHLLLTPITRLVDGVVSILPRSPFRRPLTEDGCHEEELNPAEWMSAFARVTGRFSLRPHHDPVSLEWLLARASERKRHGPLCSRVIRAKDGEVVGWYMYYGRRGETGQVLQIAAAQGAAEIVLRRLLAEVMRRGCVAVGGQLTPEFAEALATIGYVSFSLNSYTIVHSRRTDILRLIEKGDAFLTRLEGEWWTRLQEDSFQEQDNVPDAVLTRSSGGSHSPQDL